MTLTPLKSGASDLLATLRRGERIVSPVVVKRRGARLTFPWGIAGERPRSVNTHCVAALLRRGIAAIVDTDQGKELRLR